MPPAPFCRRSASRQRMILILRRTNAADGRKTAFVNDRRVSGEVLRDLSDTLVELHGQHDDRGLLNPVVIGRCWTHLLRLTFRPCARVAPSASPPVAARRCPRRRCRRPRRGGFPAPCRRRTWQAQPGARRRCGARHTPAPDAGRRTDRADIARAHAALTDGARARCWTPDAGLRAPRRARRGGLDTALAALGRALIELGEAQAGSNPACGRSISTRWNWRPLEERLRYPGACPQARCSAG